MTETMPLRDGPAPSDRYAAATWLAQRHERVWGLAQRLGAITSYSEADPPADSYQVDPDVVAQAVYDADQHAVEWALYAATRSAPTSAQFHGRDDADEAYERAYDSWLEDGPKGTDAGAAFAPMSSGEQRVMRLVATLGRPDDARREAHYVSSLDWPLMRTGLSIGDASGLDHEGARILADWLEIFRAQLPPWLYEGPTAPRFVPENSGPGWAPQ